LEDFVGADKDTGLLSFFRSVLTIDPKKRISAQVCLCPAAPSILEEIFGEEMGSLTRDYIVSNNFFCVVFFYSALSSSVARLDEELCAAEKPQGLIAHSRDHTFLRMQSLGRKQTLKKDGACEGAWQRCETRVPFRERVHGWDRRSNQKRSDQPFCLWIKSGQTHFSYPKHGTC
jgi:hypothetical protein